MRVRRLLGLSDGYGLGLRLGLGLGMQGQMSTLVMIAIAVHYSQNPTPMRTLAIMDLGYTWGETTSQNLRPRYDRHFVSITWHNV